MTSGGDSPGMNAAIRSVVRTCAYYRTECVGIYRGYQGMIEGDFTQLTARSVNNIVHKGGTILKSARSKEFMTAEGRKKAHENLLEHNDMTEIPLLTFDKLFDLVEENRFENKTDKKIAEKILEAENDWGDWKTSVNNLNEFILVLEKEINGITTQSNLEKLLNRYNQNLSKYAWESESLCSLLEIFELTKESELRTIFFNIANNNKTE